MDVFQYEHDGRHEDGARMNVDHIKPLSYHWNLRLAPHNLQTLCATFNHGKGGKTGDHRGP